MIPIPRPGTFREIKGLESVREMEHISAIDITITAGSRVEPPPEGDRYLGFIFARADAPELAERDLRKAMETLEVVIE
jgi:hypothetical protein